MSEHPQPDARRAGRRSIRLDLIVALALAAILSLGWALTDWTRLSRLLLPDPDDMMRLAQVRDWLAGQGINDWTQYRMAPPLGTPMHWSRVNDFGIAAIILALAPLVGRHHAELIAVLTYPALLFTCMLFLSARIGRRLWGPGAGPVAAVLAALAYPGTTVFVPGRIDHHALQAVLIQLFVLLLMRAPGLACGMAAGAVAAISLVVGLETAPQVAALVSVLVLLWATRGIGERARLGGFALGLAGITLCFLIFLRPTYWTATLCDAFTPASSTGTLAVAAALAALALATPKLPTSRWRLAAAAVLGAGLLFATLRAFPACISGPYDVMDPFLRANFLLHIEEANGIAAQPRLARAIAIAGVSFAACVACLWMAAREPRRWPVWLPIAVVVLTSGLVMLVQVRGAYIGAPLGAPVLAGLVLAARRRETWRGPALIGAWLAGAGLAYFALPDRIAQLLRPGATPAVSPTITMSCGVGDGWRQVDRYPSGVAMAGTNIAAYFVGATRHSTIGAGYHRNNSGNMAMYSFYLSTPDRSREIARAWKVGYVAFCPGDFSEMDVTKSYPHSLAAQLQAGHAPLWLEPLALRDTPLRFYRIRP